LHALGDGKRLYAVSNSSRNPGPKRTIYLHREVLSYFLGRRLLTTEHVHHLNGNKLDNRLSNLQILSSAIHTLVTALEAENKKLREEIERLKQCGEFARLNFQEEKT
jgi:hypothetical protein